MFDPFGTDGWSWLKERIELEGFYWCVEVDGLMGQHYPGHTCCWVDYDQGILY